MSFLTGTNCELIYGNTASGTAKNTFTSEALINDTAGMGVQAHLPPDFWLPKPNSIGNGIRIVARGVLGSTLTPSYTINVRLGASGVAGPIVLGSAAMVTGSGVTSQYWELEGDVVLTAVGAAGANSTVRGQGQFRCGGLASPFMYGLGASSSLTTPTVATLDTTITNYINVTATCTASNASNTITVQQLLVFGLN